MDGLLNTRTAKVTFDYLRRDPDLGPKVGNRGINYFTKERLQRYLRELQGTCKSFRQMPSDRHSLAFSYSPKQYPPPS